MYFFSVHIIYNVSAYDPYNCFSFGHGIVSPSNYRLWLHLLSYSIVCIIEWVLPMLKRWVSTVHWQITERSFLKIEEKFEDIKVVIISL
jgi:hypothetical protein